MTDDWDEYVYCWNCGIKLHTVDPDDSDFDEKSKCQRCEMPQFDSEGNEIICMEQYKESGEKK